MSRTRIVKGKIYESVEEHFSYYSEKGIVESSAVNYTENSETNIIHGGSPENPPSADLVSYYVKVRIKDPANYNGTFGFDWIDIDPITEEIKKIQDVDVSNVEYFYKKGATITDLGDIVAKSSDEPGAKTVIAENYRFPDSLKPCTDGRVDRPFVLIKPGQEISLSLEVNIPAGGALVDEKIYLTDDDFYSFEMVGGTKDATTKKSEIKISSDKEVVELKIKYLKESPSEKKYTILQENPTKKGIPVGGFFMMENKVLKLKFRVIALVSSDGAPATKAQALFQKFKDNDIKKYLNENSLNQAGYEVEIENQTMFDTLGSRDLDDYFYAFDKTDWTTKKYFANITKQKPDVMPGTNTCRAGSWDSVKKECAKIPVPTDVITEDNQIDDKVFELYQEKLKKKTPSKIYEGGVIILCDYESPSDTSAFSRTSPLNHYKLFVYSTSIGEKDHYAHEIGHMLGLEHTFITIDASRNKDDKKEYQDKKDQINKYNQDNIVPTKLIIDNEKISNRGKALGKQSKSITTFAEGYNGIKKTTLLNCIDNSNNYFDARIRDYTAQINAVNNSTNYTMPKKGEDGKWILNSDGKTAKQFPTTPALFKERLRDQKKDFEEYKQNNLNSKSKLEGISNKGHINFDNEFDLVSEDCLKLYEDYMKKLMQEWQQMISNYLYFKQNSTQNIMDYTTSDRLRFLNHQILIMRNDYENY